MPPVPLHTPILRAHSGVAVGRAWSRELRDAVALARQARGGLAGVAVVAPLVLRSALRSVGAARGAVLLPGSVEGARRVAADEGVGRGRWQAAVVERFASEPVGVDRVLHVQDGAAPGAIVAVALAASRNATGVLVLGDHPAAFAGIDDDALLILADQASGALQAATGADVARGTFAAALTALTSAEPPGAAAAPDHLDAVAVQLALSPTQRRRLALAALLRDVGQTDAVARPQPLSRTERAAVRHHPAAGAELLGAAHGLQETARLVRHHHERWDGEGYPEGLQGTDIPLGSRLLAIDDAFRAMTAERPHRPQTSAAAACAELRRGAGTQFDPELVGLYVAAVRADTAVGPTRHEPAVGLRSHGDFVQAADDAALRAWPQNSGFGVVLVELITLDALVREFGDAAGDEAVRRCSASFARLAARHGGIAHRLGGPRLGMVVPDTSPAGAQRIAGLLRAELGALLPVVAAGAAWEPGDSGASVIARARAELRVAVPSDL